MFVSLNSPVSSVKDANEWGCLSTSPVSLNVADRNNFISFVTFDHNNISATKSDGKWIKNNPNDTFLTERNVTVYVEFNVMYSALWFPGHIIALISAACPLQHLQNSLLESASQMFTEYQHWKCAVHARQLL